MKILLVNMPFFRCGQPSFVLTQIRGILRARLGEQMDTEILYLNHDFASFLGVELSERISFSNEIVATGIGEWFFKHTAFPGGEDVSGLFLNRYFPGRKFRELKKALLEKRSRLDEFLDRIMETYQPHRADLVGFSSMISQNLSSISLANRIKQENSNCTVIMGGSNCLPPMGEEIVKNIQSIDFTFSGPSLKSFPRFIRHTLDGEPEKRHRIRGVFSPSNCRPGGTHHNRPAEELKGEELNINTEIEIDYDDFFRSLDGKLKGENINPVLLFETSRGCWWGEKSRCSFCGMDSATLRSQVMNPGLAVKTINSVLRYAPRCRIFMATDIIMPKNYPREVFPRIKTPPHTTLLYEVRATMDREELRSISTAGVKAVSSGIECLSTSSLKLAGKGTSVFSNIMFMKNCLLADVHPAWLFLVGIPGESGDTYRRYLEIIPRVLHLPPPYYVSPVIFERDNYYFYHPGEFGLNLKPYDWYEMIYPLDNDITDRLAILFMNTNTSLPYYRGLFDYFHRLKGEINRWIDRWFDPGEQEKPALYFYSRDGREMVYDSRGDVAVQHQLDSEEIELLKILEKPGTLSGLEEKLPHISPEQLGEHLDELDDKALILRQGEMMINLVLPEKPPPLTFISGKRTDKIPIKFSWEKVFHHSHYRS